MATAKEYYDCVMECLGRELNVTSCKMMGEYCLYFEGTLFGGIYDNRFLVASLKYPMKEVNLKCFLWKSLKILNL